MKFINSLYSTNELEFVMNVQPKNQKNSNQGASSDGPLVTVHRSRVGNMTLVFSPTVALVVRSRSRSIEDNAWIPLHLIPRFTSNVASVYHTLSDGKIVHSDNGKMFIDKKKAVSASVKMSLFRNGLMIAPAVLDSAGKPTVGISMSIDGKIIGSMVHSEAMSLVDILDRLDLATYSVMAGMVDKLAEIDTKTEEILRVTMDIRNLMERSGGKPSTITMVDDNPSMNFVEYDPRR